MPSLDHCSPYVSLGTACSCLLDWHCDVDVEVYDAAGVSQWVFWILFELGSPVRE